MCLEKRESIPKKFIDLKNLVTQAAERDGNKEATKCNKILAKKVGLRSNVIGT